MGHPVGGAGLTSPTTTDDRMRRKRLPIIDNPDGRTILENPPGDISPRQGEFGDIELLCGNCRHTLAERTLPDRADGTVIRCPVCRAFNLNGTPKPGEQQPPTSGWNTIRPLDPGHP